MIIEKTKDQILIKISPKVDTFVKLNNLMLTNLLINLIKDGEIRIRTASFNENHC